MFVSSTMKPDGFFVFGSMNCSGGNERSTPRSAFLLLVHLSRIESPVAREAANAGAAADPPTRAVAPTPRSAAFSRLLRVVPGSNWLISLSGMSASQWMSETSGASASAMFA
jgi:hypothetical protein